MSFVAQRMEIAGSSRGLGDVLHRKMAHSESKGAVSACSQIQASAGEGIVYAEHGHRCMQANMRGLQDVGRQSVGRLLNTWTRPRIALPTMDLRTTRETSCGIPAARSHGRTLSITLLFQNRGAGTAIQNEMCFDCWEP